MSHRRQNSAATRYRHPVNQKLIDEAPLGARVADRVTGFMGSWRFIIVQTIIVVIWLVANIYLLSQPFDPYPFILLNLAFSTQAAYAAPLILLAGNRAAVHDRILPCNTQPTNPMLKSSRTSSSSGGPGKSLEALDGTLAERTLAIQEAIKAQGEQLLRMEQAILAFESEGAQAAPSCPGGVGALPAGP